MIDISKMYIIDAGRCREIYIIDICEIYVIDGLGVDHDSLDHLTIFLHLLIMINTNESGGYSTQYSASKH